MVHLVVTAVPWSPKYVNYTTREKQKHVEVHKQTWYLEESPLSHMAARILSSVEEKCELAGHNRKKNKSDQKFIIHCKEKIKSKKSSVIKNISEKKRGNKSVLVSTTDRGRTNGLKYRKRH